MTTILKSRRVRLALRLIAQFERRHGVLLGIRAVRISAGLGADYSPVDRVVRIGDALRGRAWREHLYHEVAHALVHTYGLARYRRVFTRAKRPLTNLGARRKGFVSPYAARDWEEDFAETLACYVLNDGRTRGTVVFEGREIPLAVDPTLQRKLRAVRAILLSCEGRTERLSRDQ